MAGSFKTGIASFQARMNRRAKQVVTGTNEAKKLVAKAANQFVVLDTPVDTGEARGGWSATLGFGSDISTGLDQGGVSTISKNNRTIDQAQPEQAVFLTNRIEHITALNEGHSDQAPSGFVRRAVRAAIDALGRAESVWMS